jgi:hypothetical protein
MTSKLCSNRWDELNGHRAESFLYDNHFHWGKAYIDGDEAILMQAPVTCKDYVVDTYFRTGTHLFQREHWTEQQCHSTCVYVVLPNEEYATRLVKNITQCLHAFEKTNKLARTVATRVTKGPFTQPTFVITGSSLWTRNATVWSMYLSLLRMCAVTANYKSIHFTQDTADFSCNEHSYFASKPEHQQLILDCYKNIRTWMKPLPETHTKTGYTSGVTVGHGQTGLFYLFQMFTALKARNLQERIITQLKSNYFAQLLHKDLYKGKSFDQVTHTYRSFNW